MSRWPLLGLWLVVACVDVGYDVARGDGGPGRDPDAGAADPDGGGPDGATGGCVEGPASPESASLVIHIGALSVDRPQASLTVGSVVVWQNDDGMIHRMVAGVPGDERPLARGGFESPDLGPGDRYAHRFCRPVSLIYHCSTHPALMSGYRMIVE